MLEEKWNIEAREPFKSSYPAKNRLFGFKWCSGKDGCCKKGEGDCDKNELDHFSFSLFTFAFWNHHGFSMKKSSV